MILSFDTKNLNPANWFKKEEESEIEIPDRITIEFTQEAREKGTLDDFNKEVKRYKNGVVVERKSYSIHLAKAMAKIHTLPILDLTTPQEEDYEFDEITALHGNMRKIVRL